MSVKDTIVELETSFWQSLLDQNVTGAVALLADEVVLAGPGGFTKTNPAAYEEALAESESELQRYIIEQIEVIVPSETTAVMAYVVHQTVTINGERVDWACANTATWVRGGGSWKCVLRTEVELPRTIEE